jgi:hypothetical protein
MTHSGIGPDVRRAVYMKNCPSRKTCRDLIQRKDISTLWSKQNQILLLYFAALTESKGKENVATGNTWAIRLGTRSGVG